MGLASSRKPFPRKYNRVQVGLVWPKCETALSFFPSQCPHHLPCTTCSMPVTLDQLPLTHSIRQPPRGCGSGRWEEASKAEREKRQGRRREGTRTTKAKSVNTALPPGYVPTRPRLTSPPSLFNNYLSSVPFILSSLPRSPLNHVIECRASGRMQGLLLQLQIR